MRHDDNRLRRADRFVMKCGNRAVWQKRAVGPRQAASSVRYSRQGICVCVCARSNLGRFPTVAGRIDCPGEGGPFSRILPRPRLTRLKRQQKSQRPNSLYLPAINYYDGCPIFFILFSTYPCQYARRLEYTAAPYMVPHDRPAVVWAGR
jgi:hypothetical protein